MSHSWRTLLFLLAIWLGMGGQALAQIQNGAGANDLESLLDTGISSPPTEVGASTTSRFSQGIAHSPSAVYVITHDEIVNHDYRTLGEVLNTLPGLFSSDDHQNVFLGIRGFNHPGDYNTRVLIMIDGVRINDNIFDSVFVGRSFPLDVGLIDRIEYAPGPGSAIYGNNAFFGVINVITRGAASLRGTEVSVRRGSFNSDDGRVSVGRRLDTGLEYVFSASESYRGGPAVPYYADFSISALPGTPLRSVDSERAKQVFAKVSYQSWSFLAGFSEREKDNPVIVGLINPDQLGIYPENQDSLFDRTLFTRLAYADEIYQGWNLDANLEFHTSDYLGVAPTYLNPYQYYDSDEQAHGRWWNANLTLVYNRLAAHKILIGTDTQWNVIQEWKTYIPNTPDLQSARAHSHRLGVFAQDEWEFNAHWESILGLRYDATEFGRNIHPRLGLIWHPDEKNNLKLLYGSAFRDPNFFEQSQNAFAGAPPEQSETVKTAEFVFEHFLTDSTRVTTSLYRSRFDNLSSLELTPNGGIYENTAPLHSLGLEVAAEHRFASGAQLNASYSLQRTEQNGYGIIDSPGSLVKLRLQSQSLGAWKLAGEANYVSQVMSNTDFLPAYWLVNLVLQRQIGKHLRLTLGAHNLLNRTVYQPTRSLYVDTDTVKQDGRDLRLTLQLNY